ncbi:UNVERIFIED_CONTAM: hypothetical protein Sindi_1982900 [Sesamum indicum]
MGRSKRDVFDDLKDRIWRKIQSWLARQLSQAGCAVLIKSVLQAIPSYAMSCFKLLDGLLSDMESRMANFFWNQESSRKFHWLAWRKLCLSKKEGGLGFAVYRSSIRPCCANKLGI